MPFKRYVVLASLLSFTLTETAPVLPETQSHELLYGRPLLFSIINNVALPADDTRAWRRDSVFSAYTYSASFWRETSLITFRHMLGAMVAVRLDEMTGPTYGLISQLVREQSKARAMANKRAPLQDPSAAQTHETSGLVQRLGELRTRLERLIEFNDALTVISTRLEHIAGFLNNASDENSKDITMDINTLLDQTEKEIQKLIRKLEKMLREFKKWLEKMEASDLEDLIWKLHAIIENVEISDDGTIIIGDTELDLDDAISGLCCPFG